MTINETIVKELEHTYRKHLPNDLKQYLLVKYAEEPFPYELSAQDFYMNIERDIQAYETGELDIPLKSRSESWQEEREYLRNLYIEKCCEARELSDYVAELEHMLSENCLESPKMAKRRIDLSRTTAF
ncbi:MAG: hypothetical protein AVO34_11610 [Firmicutes bacterium ML8_F2]|jgi:intein/homing endonuclease|nr:MAG: hypothetical protein AVO34_11610 [Firmicutes bacterium ML8_F2]